MNSSLRLRLVIIILVPLLLIAALLANWAFNDAQSRAEERFDQSLLSAALAVSRDVALSDGDALSPETNALLRDTSDGAVFYHVYAPDGVFVTGYATPPLPAAETTSPQSGQTYFDGTYLGDPVRALRFSDSMQFDGLVGEFTITVWQPMALRATMAQDMSWQTFQVMTALVVAVALIVWFGVRYGLKPLLNLEAAIKQRSPDDLTPIQRQIPIEAKGIVATLNHLFDQVTTTIEAKNVFISNAAHQLRNPIAGVVAMTEALGSAKTTEDIQERSQELKKASHHVADLANKLLTLDRASAGTAQMRKTNFDVRDAIDRSVERHLKTAKARGVTLSATLSDTAVYIVGDEILIEEGVTNLIENALKHGGKSMRSIEIGLKENARHIEIEVKDDGVGIPQEAIELVKERFGQVHPSDGSGLGLAIVQAIARHHGGSLAIHPERSGLKVALRLKKTEQLASPK